MENGQWHTVCRTCIEEDVSSHYEEAKKFFGLHAEQDHDVEMTNLKVADPQE